MAITLGTTSVTFGDSSTQSTFGVDGGNLISITTYTTAGSGTYTVPAGAYNLFVRVIGGGGGSAGYAESGGGGGYAEKWFTRNGNSVAPGGTFSYTVGAGGTNVTYYTSAGNGGTSSFGGAVSASGGYGANTAYTHTGGAGGLGSSGDVNLYGGGGTGHGNGAHQAGRGGGSYYGSGKCQQWTEGTNTTIGTGAPGAGAPGARTVHGNQGSDGTPGMVIVYAFS
jgi:hypothetical protein